MYRSRDFEFISISADDPAARDKVYKFLQKKQASNTNYLFNIDNKYKLIEAVDPNVGVRDQQIEKDYILSWILKGIAQHEQLSKVIVFKGGTVLKKIYFEDYRFSEDLDFTLINNAPLPDRQETSNEQIFEWFKKTFD